MLGNMLRRVCTKSASVAALVVGASLTLGLASAMALAGPSVQAECEAFVDNHNIDGLRIQTVFCSGASGYYAAFGIDVIGEWIEVIVDAPVTGYYQPTVAYQTASRREVSPS